MKYEELIEFTEETLNCKAQGYAGEMNRWENFEHASRIDPRFTPEGHAWNWAMKHAERAIYIWKSGGKTEDSVILEKFGDLLNYCLIIKSMKKKINFIPCSDYIPRPGDQAYQVEHLIGAVAMYCDKPSEIILDEIIAITSSFILRYVS